MTTPLELAELLEEGPHRAGDAFIAAELRRLAQVEAEHAALLKAISDAEPVAWMMKWPNHSPSFTTDKSDYVSWFAGKASYPDELSPLYTLNGIKKP